MTLLTSKFINPFTDFGFKRLFGEEANKDLLKSFLNELLYEQEGNITDIQYLKTEQLGNTPIDRQAIFDIYCTNERGQHFIVELQKTKQKYFKDRSIFYSSFAIQQQAERGQEWNFQLNNVYTIAILDFEFDDNHHDKYRYDVKLIEEELQEVFYEKVQFIYLVMPRFKKDLNELTTHFDKWLYAFKHLHRLDDIPANLQDAIFQKLFDSACIANFDKNERMVYEDSIKAYRDFKNSIDTAKDEGRVEGREEGIMQTAKNLKQMDMTIEMIQQATGLTTEQINAL